MRKAPSIKLPLPAAVLKAAVCRRRIIFENSDLLQD